MYITRKHAKKWQSLPNGWTDESAKKFWESLVGDVKHKVTKCMNKLEDSMDDPGAFCASLRDRVEGTKWRSERKASFNWRQQLFEVFQQYGDVPPDVDWAQDARALLSDIEEWDFFGHQVIDIQHDGIVRQTLNCPTEMDIGLDLFLKPSFLLSKIKGDTQSFLVPEGLLKGKGLVAFGEILSRVLRQHINNPEWWRANVVETDEFQAIWNRIGRYVHGEVIRVEPYPKPVRLDFYPDRLVFYMGAILTFKCERL